MAPYATAAINGTELRLFLFKEVLQCALLFVIRCKYSKYILIFSGKL